MEDGGWRMEDGGWRMEDGGWRMEDGGWRMEDGGWRMKDGGWRMEDGGWRMVIAGAGSTVGIGSIVGRGFHSGAQVPQWGAGSTPRRSTRARIPSNLCQAFSPI